MSEYKFLFIVGQIKLAFSRKYLHLTSSRKWGILELFITYGEVNVNAIIYISVFVLMNKCFLLCARLFPFIGLCVDDGDDFSESDYDDDNDDDNNENDATDHDELKP